MKEQVCENCGFKYVFSGQLQDDMPYCGACYPRNFEMWLVEMKKHKHPLYLDYQHAEKDDKKAKSFKSLRYAYNSKNIEKNQLGWIATQQLRAKQ